VSSGRHPPSPIRCILKSWKDWLSSRCSPCKGRHLPEGNLPEVLHSWKKYMEFQELKIIVYFRRPVKVKPGNYYIDVLSHLCFSPYLFVLSHTYIYDVIDIVND